jgi:hypothetical protein
MSLPSDDLDKWLDNLFDLIDRKIPEHHLKAKFIDDVKTAIRTRIAAEVRAAERKMLEYAQGTYRVNAHKDAEHIIEIAITHRSAELTDQPEPKGGA